jgi:hypothetical protein
MNIDLMQNYPLIQLTYLSSAICTLNNVTNPTQSLVWTWEGELFWPLLSICLLWCCLYPVNQPTNVTNKASQMNQLTRKKSTLFWSMTPYSLAEVYRHLGGKFCAHFQGRPWRNLPEFWRNVGNIHTTRRHIPENKTLQSNGRENLKSNITNWSLRNM